MKKTREVFMVPTEDVKSPLCVCIKDFEFDHKGRLCLTKGSEHVDTERYQYQHIYFTSDEAIRYNDWWIDTETKKIEQCKSNENALDLFTECKKIVATTDPKLDEEILFTEWRPSTPKVPMSFIEHYVNAPVKEVELEYEDNLWIQDYAESPNQMLPPMQNLGGKLKLIDNEVIICK